MYYNVRVVFERFVPDTTDETNSLALAQATSYAIMDYFNQYTYAEVSANMISEIAYTETMTFWSTLISAPLVYFGSWAVKGTEKMMGEASVKLVEMGKMTQGQAIKRMLLKGLAGMAASPIMEVFQEIIEDGFKEALAENIVGILGGNDDLGFWISSYWTAGREATGALGQLSLGTSANMQNSISLIHAMISGDSNTRLEIQQSIAQDLKAKQDAETARLAQMSFLDKMLKTGFLKGLFMVIPSVLFGSFSFVALSGLKKMTTSLIKLSPAAYAEYSALKHNGRKRPIGVAVGGQATGSANDKVLEQAKKPAGLNSVAPNINSEYKDLQESDKKSAPLIQVLSNINPNPKNIIISKILNKFKSLISSAWSNEIEVRKTEDSLVAENIDKIVDESSQSKESDVILDKIIGDDFEGLFPEHDPSTINYIYSKLFDPEYDQKKPKDVLGQINYRCSLISEARQVLKSAKYYGLDILIDEIINPYVLAILQDKFNKGERFSKLERIIADVASFYMGSSQVKHDGGYDLDTIREYEEETGKKAFLSNSPTKSFTDWFNAKKARDVMIKKVDGLVKSVVDDYMESLDRSKLQFRQLHFQNYVSDPSDIDKIYNNRRKYCWTGIVYRITELKEENGKIVEGRKLYGLSMDDLESRWKWYKTHALDDDSENFRIHDAIFDIDERILYGEIDGDIDDWFKREVVEVHWDEHSMRQREKDWIKKDKTQDLAVGFNTKAGGEGSHKIHIPIRLLAECIAKGLKVSEIKIELEIHGIYVSKSTLYSRINERYGSVLEARKIFLKPIIKQLIKEGYEKRDIEGSLSTKAKSFLRALIPNLFGVSYTALRKRYLLEMVSPILQTGIQDLTYAKIHSFLPQLGRREIENLIVGKWSGILNAKALFGREIAIYLFRKGASDEYILKVLGYSESTIQQSKSNIDRIFKKLFNGLQWTADEARKYFTSGYKNVEGHFIWYSDSDNY